MSLSNNFNSVKEKVLVIINNRCINKKNVSSVTLKLNLMQKHLLGRATENCTVHAKNNRRFKSKNNAKLKHKLIRMTLKEKTKIKKNSSLQGINKLGNR